MRVYVHICIRDTTRQMKMREMWGYLQHYPGAVLNHTSNQITIPHVMVHIFLTAAFEFEQLGGLSLKGFDVEYGADLEPEQMDFLRSRVR